MKAKLLNISLVFLLLIMFATILYQKNKIFRLKNYTEITLRKSSYINSLLRTNWKLGGFKITGELINENKYDSTYWSDFNFKDSIIVYRQPVLGCTTCFEEKFEFFKKCCDSLNLPTMVVTRKTEERNLANFKRLSLYSDNVYFSNDVIPDLDLLSMTYIFLFENNRITSVHIPNVEFPEYTQMYLESIINRHKKNIEIFVQ